jgi:hypothetical protein
MTQIRSKLASKKAEVEASDHALRFRHSGNEVTRDMLMFI